jgi:erythronate-4-phosphate dehydrogenase
VAEYFVSAMLCLANRHGMTLSDKMIGIVGLGHVGSRVMTMAEKLGMQVLLNDPPRERSEGGNGSGQGLPFLPLEFVLQQADIVTLHTPLTREGVDPTHHLAGPLFFDSLKQGCIFVNAARGAIVDTATLIRAIDRGTVGHAVIDTWEEEPAYSPELLARADLATPHIAGYSFDGLVNGTVRVYHEACRHFGVEPTWNPDALIPDPEAKNVTAEAGTSNRDVFLWDIVRQAYDIEADDRAMRDTCAESANERGRAFEQLRKNYPVRREFHASTTHLTTDQEGMGEILAGLGFSCSTYT